jgi:hypothetical protein
MMNFKGVKQTSIKIASVMGTIPVVNRYTYNEFYPQI